MGVARTIGRRLGERRWGRIPVQGLAALAGLAGLAALSAVLATAIGMGGCAASPPLSPTIVILGAIEVAPGARLPPGSQVSVRLTRGGTVIDELSFDAVQTPPPYAFQLLYDRDDAGGVGAITAEARRSGRVVLTTLEAVPLPLDGTPRTVVCRLAPPRRAIGP